MCMLCQKQDDFSFQHIELEAKKLTQQQLFAKAKEVKDSIKKLEIWLTGDRCDGFEKEAVDDSIEYLKTIQYTLSKRM